MLEFIVIAVLFVIVMYTFAYSIVFAIIATAYFTECVTNIFNYFRTGNPWPSKGSIQKPYTQ